MPLPVLHSSYAQSDDDLLRLFRRTELHWTRHLAEEEVLEVGVAFVNPTLGSIWEANRVLDAAVPIGISAQQCIDEVESYYKRRGLICGGWVMNSGARPDVSRVLAESLNIAGWRALMIDVLHLPVLVATAPSDIPGLTIIPARAAFRHAQAIAQEEAAEADLPQRADASLLHLDDSHYDALLALMDGRAVGRVGVLSAGDVGRVDELFVAAPFRRRGIGRILVGRAIEICARSLFRHVLLAVLPEESRAGNLFARFGFHKIGQLSAYLSPRLPDVSQAPDESPVNP